MCVVCGTAGPERTREFSRTRVTVGRLQAADLVTRASLKADLENEKAAKKRLRGELRACRSRLSELMGSTVAGDTLGDDTDCRPGPGELGEENPNASRANCRIIEGNRSRPSRNRDLTTRLNARRPATRGPGDDRRQCSRWRQASSAGADRLSQMVVVVMLFTIADLAAGGELREGASSRGIQRWAAFGFKNRQQTVAVTSPGQTMVPYCVPASFMPDSPFWSR